MINVNVSKLKFVYCLIFFVSYILIFMVFMFQYCRIFELLFKLFDVKVNNLVFFEKDWDNFNGDVLDFLFVVVEYIKVLLVGLYDSDIILKNVINFLG